MMIKPSHLKGILEKSELEVDSVENPFRDYFVVKLIPKNELYWKAGEHGIFSFGGYGIKGKNSRIFSVASIPGEGCLMIGTRTGEKMSSFKRKLTELKKGDKVNLRGPLGWFLLRDEHSPVVMIAGGVGITPIRAILKELEKGNGRKVEVVYSSGNGFLFEEDLRAIAEKDKLISLNFTSGREETAKLVGELAKKYKSEAFYYVSGSPKMVGSIKRLIGKEGAKKGRIIYDPFYGYKK